MTTHDVHAEPNRTASRRAPWSLVGSAVGFLLLYLSTDFVAVKLASSPLPLPNAPAEEAKAWFAGNQLAAVVMGLSQLLSVMCLAAFVVGLRRSAVAVSQVRAARRAAPWGLLSVTLMAAATVLSWWSAAVAPTASVDTVSVLRTANFVAGGTAHVLLLGIFVLLASRIPGFGTAVRVFGIVAAVPAVASIVSLVWFQGAALILLGRLLCMAWTISAAVSVTRRLARGVWAAR